MGNDYYSNPNALSMGMPNTNPQPAWANFLGNTASSVASTGLSSALGLLGSANPVGFLASAAPGLASGVMGILGGLLAPSQKTKDKWQREHLQKLSQQRVNMTDKYLKPADKYVNLAGNNMQPMGDLLQQILAKKAAMYTGVGGASSPPWASALSGIGTGLNRG